jgi:hypothetical protein
VVFGTIRNLVLQAENNLIWGGFRNVYYEAAGKGVQLPVDAGDDDGFFFGMFHDFTEKRRPSRSTRSRAK